MINFDHFNKQQAGIVDTDVDCETRCRAGPSARYHGKHRRYHEQAARHEAITQDLLRERNQQKGWGHRYTNTNSIVIAKSNYRDHIDQPDQLFQPEYSICDCPYCSLLSNPFPGNFSVLLPFSSSYFYI